MPAKYSLETVKEKQGRKHGWGGQEESKGRQHEGFKKQGYLNSSNQYSLHHDFSKKIRDLSKKNILGGRDSGARLEMDDALNQDPRKK